jgi:hypothetical protein
MVDVLQLPIICGTRLHVWANSRFPSARFALLLNWNKGGSGRLSFGAIDALAVLRSDSLRADLVPQPRSGLYAGGQPRAAEPDRDGREPL